MDIQLYSGDTSVVHTYNRHSSIIIKGERDECAVGVEFNSRLQYIIIIEKNDSVKVFSFRSKGWASEFDFGWWADGTKIFESK